MKLIHIIEDDPVFSFVLKNFLKEFYIIKEYRSIEEYSQVEEIPDLALLDFNLGAQTSTGLLKKLKSTKIIAMSSSNDIDTWNFALNSNVTDFYHKGKHSLTELKVKIKMA